MHHEPCCFLGSGRWKRGACFSSQIGKRDFGKTAQNLAYVPSDEGHIVSGLQPGNLKWRERERERETGWLAAPTKERGRCLVNLGNDLQILTKLVHEGGEVAIVATDGKICLQG